MSQGIFQAPTKPVTLNYEADLCGNIEQALKGLQGYGIMALELIQNADDAHATILTFDVRPNALHVRNNATFSSCGLSEKRCPWERTGDPEGRERPCNFHAISRMGSRSKILAPEQIGRFGIGFVSVYQITDTPIIRSVDLQLCLNPLTGEVGTLRIDHVDHTEFELGWASLPSDIRKALNASPTPADVASKITEEVVSVLQKSLLFLRHLERVEVRQDGRESFAVNITRSASEISFNFEPQAQSKKWMVLSRTADDLIEQGKLFTKYEALSKLDRARVISVAIPLHHEEVIEGLLFAYLPTKQTTGMPLHINGDFFPHASRQAIVLSGEGHERYWNETLLATAAATIGENFTVLREKLGHDRLWKLGQAAFQHREQGAFSKFWVAFSQAAAATESVWTITGQWYRPSQVFAAPPQLTEPQQIALSSIGIPLLHPSLRPYKNELSKVGVRDLQLSTIAASLEALGEKGIQTSNPRLKVIWDAISTMIEISRTRPGFQTAIKQIGAATFLMDIDGHPVSPNQVWRLPPAVSAIRVRRILQNCPIVSQDVMANVHLAGIIDEYQLDDFANDIALEITDPNVAAERIGSSSEDVRDLYALLTDFPIDENTTEAGSTLTNTPLLRTSMGFVTPARGQLPGDFHDPIEYFEFVDASLFTSKMHQFARNVLRVRVLSFREYIDDHLEDILAREPNREQYRALLTEVVRHGNELDEEGSLALLAKKNFLRNRAGTFVRPDECYYWSAALERLLGSDDTRWVDDAWMPVGLFAVRFRDLLENRMGMPTMVSARHIVDRIEMISDSSTPEAVDQAITPIVRYIFERWSRFGDDDREVLAELRDIEFIPAQIDGKRDDEQLYIPTEVYRAGRAPGFSSQVPVVDMIPLRQAGTVVNEFLDLLEMPPEPPTSAVVAHLEHCMANGLAVSDLTYAILDERVEKADDLPSIDKLKGKAVIFRPDPDRFLSTDSVFWKTPPFGGYWHAASSRMRQREGLYRRLGVLDDPRPPDYAALMIQISRLPTRNDGDFIIHARCLEHLAEALERGDEGVESAIELLRGEPALINLEHQPISCEGAIWIDSEQLATPFGEALNEHLVRQPGVQRAAVARLFRQLGTSPLSEIARLRLATEPDNRPAPEATILLAERGDLLLWLAPNPISREELGRILDALEIRLTQTLKIQAEITEFDPVVRSPATPATAFYQRDKSVLHVRGDSISSQGWTAAFRAIFSEIERYCPSSDIKPLVTTASFVMLLPSREVAEDTLRQSDYRPPIDDANLVPVGHELSDEPVDISPVAEGEYAPAQLPSSDALPVGNAEKAAADTESDEMIEKQSSSTSSEKYGSKENDGSFGKQTPESNARTAVGDTKIGRSPSNLMPGTKRHRETTRERQVRRSRMLAYVTKAGVREPGDSDDGRTTNDLSEQIDAAAITAALKYEDKRGWLPEEQPHENPGYDIVSRSPEGRRRLIEVKGLEGPWTERGIKLTHVQYAMAAEYPEEYWIYVVEHARSLEQQIVSAIGSPFSKVDEYWFDQNWRDLREETINGLQLNIHIGARVRHKLWGEGPIHQVERRGLVTYVKVDFGFQGMKYIPYDEQLTISD